MIVHFTIPIRFDTQDHPVVARATGDNWFDVHVHGTDNWGDAEVAAREFVVSTFGNKCFCTTHPDDESWTKAVDRFYPGGCIETLKTRVSGVDTP